MRLHINDREVEIDGLADDTPLLWVIRDNIGLTGTKYSCGIGRCGSCTVHLDGRAVRACVTPVASAIGKSIRTIEGLEGATLHAVQAAWLDAGVPQCGFCQPGMIMAIAALLDAQPDVGPDALFAQITNLCRCGSYPRIRRAIETLRGAPAGNGIVEEGA